jgi:hypothetical protein
MYYKNRAATALAFTFATMVIVAYSRKMFMALASRSVWVKVVNTLAYYIEIKARPRPLN